LHSEPTCPSLTFTDTVQDAAAASVTPESTMLLEPPVAVTVPPQVVLRPLGVATVMPVGSVSVNPIPERETGLGLGFVTVKVKVALEFNGPLGALNAFVTVGGPATSSDAVPGVELPPFVEVATTLLFFWPGAVPVTPTEIAQEPLAASVNPLRDMTDAPALAVNVPAQPFVAPGGVSTTRPEGRLSVKAIPLRVPVEVSVFGFEIKNVTTVLEPVVISGTLKLFVIIGGANTENFALALDPAPLSVALMTPVVFVFKPVTRLVSVTLTAKVQDAFAASVAPVRVMLVDAGVAVIVPEGQLPVRPFGLATASPAGARGSVNVIELSEAMESVFGFVTVNVSFVVPPCAIPLGLKLFVRTGGFTMVILACAVTPAPPFDELTVALFVIVPPGGVPATVTVSVQEPPMATELPKRNTLFVPATAVTVPGHVPPVGLGVARISPAGNVSVTLTEVSASVLPAGFVMV
jgi:hypothetical protein